MKTLATTDLYVGDDRRSERGLSLLECIASLAIAALVGGLAYFFTQTKGSPRRAGRGPTSCTRSGRLTHRRYPVLRFIADAWRLDDEQRAWRLGNEMDGPWQLGHRDVRGPLRAYAAGVAVSDRLRRWRQHRLRQGRPAPSSPPPSSQRRRSRSSAAAAPLGPATARPRSARSSRRSAPRPRARHRAAHAGPAPTWTTGMCRSARTGSTRILSKTTTVS